jgi:hypothetical protein
MGFFLSPAVVAADVFSVHDQQARKRGKSTTRSGWRAAQSWCHNYEAGGGYSSAPVEVAN